MPIRRIVRHQANAEVVLGEVTAIDTAARKVTLEEGSLDYDFLVVATGSTHSYFGHDAWATFAPGLKSLEDALDIRRRVLLAFEEAEQEADPERRKEWLTFVVVGGGPTGVELAGALAEISRHVLVKDFRRIDPKSARVILLEAGPRILPAYEAASSASAREQLESRGAEVRTGARVTDLDARGVTLESERILARTVLWGAGVAASGVGADARRAAGPRGPRARRTRPLRPRRPRGVRGGRSGRVRSREARSSQASPRPRCRWGRHVAKNPRPEASAAAPPCPSSLRRQGLPRDDRPRVGGGRDRLAPHVGVPRRGSRGCSSTCST